MKIRHRVQCVCKGEGGGGGGEGADFALKVPLIRNSLLSEILFEPVITLGPGNLQQEKSPSFIVA